MEDGDDGVAVGHVDVHLRERRRRRKGAKRVGARRPKEVAHQCAVAVEGGQRVGDAAEGVRDAGDDVARRRARVGLDASRLREVGERERGRVGLEDDDLAAVGVDERALVEEERLVVADEREDIHREHARAAAAALAAHWRSLHAVEENVVLVGGRRPRRGGSVVPRRHRCEAALAPVDEAREVVVEQRRVEVRPRSEHVAAAAVVRRLQH